MKWAKVEGVVIGVLVGALPLLVGLIGVRRGLHLRTERTVIPGRVSIDQVSDVVLTVVNEDARPVVEMMEKLAELGHLRLRKQSVHAPFVRAGRQPLHPGEDRC